jgi:hypothetical protein
MIFHRFMKMAWLIPVFQLFLSQLSFAGDPAQFQISGFISGACTVFHEEALYDGQKNGPQYHFVFKPEFILEQNNGLDRINFVPFLSIDNHDDRQIDLRELSWIHFGNNWFTKAGFSKVFWGVAESRHLVDIINQTDLREDMMLDEKLGQPMLNFGLMDSQWGNFEMFILPGFRERTFPGRESRFRGPLRVDNDQAHYESGAEETHVDFAVRYSNMIGNWDIGISHFYGTGREPTFLAGTDENEKPVLIPQYEIINQSGVDAQVTIDEWLWKLEMIYRAGQGESFAAVTGGVEYTLFGVLSSSTDLGLIAEYNYDGRDDEAPPTFLESDYFFGARWSLNNEDMTSLLAGFFIDRHTSAMLYRAEFETSVTEHWKINIDVVGFVNTDEDPMLDAMRQDGYASLTISYHF